MARDITKLHPTLQTKVSQLKSECTKAGLKIGIGECVRSVAEQDALYAQGRTKPGKKVTNAKGTSYSSMHQWGVAFDFYRNDGKGTYNNGDKFFQKVGAIGKKLGLEWGGDWKSPVDLPHFQLPNWGSTPSKLKSLYKTPAKFMATWKTSPTPAAKTGVAYLINGIDFSPVFNPEYYAKMNSDVVKALGSNPTTLWQHFCNCGCHEARIGSAEFNPKNYKNRYPDLAKAYGNDWVQYYVHYCKTGKEKGLNGK